MTKRAKCPKCHRDTWSEKWGCSACGYTATPWKMSVREAKARADASGDKRQKKRIAHADAKNRGDYKGPVAIFQPTAEELAEQAVGVVTSGSMRLRAKPGETCPTCNRKVPKRRKADAAD